MFLGQSLFSQEKYTEAVGHTKKVRELEKMQRVFSVRTKAHPHGPIINELWDERAGRESAHLAGGGC
jgi:hypothetical protein